LNPGAVATFVFIHGLIGGFADRRTLSVLEPATILVPNLHGYGSAVVDDEAEITIERQVECVRGLIERDAADARVHLVGHSVGGVIAASYAYRCPDRVASLVNVEGNFTLADAFWSRQLAVKQPAEVHELLERDRSDPGRWLRDQGVEPTDDRLRAAAEALAFQPSTTVQAMARAVVEYTARADYETMLRDVFDRVPVHLVAGARSRAGWDVPDWALKAAASCTEIPAAGHMVMLEAPDVLGTELCRLLRTDLGNPRHT
jgi:lipase